MEEDVLAVLLGATPAAFALAQAFDRDYGIRSVLVGSLPEEERAPYLTGIPLPATVRDGLFLRAMTDLYERTPNKSRLLLPMAEPYIALCETHRDTLEKMFLCPGAFGGGIRLPETSAPHADGILFGYQGRTGSRLCYARLCPPAPSGIPAACVTAPLPPALVQEAETAKDGKRGFFLCYTSGDRLCVAPVCGYFLGFPAAADVSLPELLLNDYVTCTPLPENIPALAGVWSPFSRRRVMPLLGKAEKKLVRKKLFLSYFGARAGFFRHRPATGRRQAEKALWDGEKPE